MVVNPTKGGTVVAQVFHSAAGGQPYRRLAAPTLAGASMCQPAMHKIESQLLAGVFGETMFSDDEAGRASAAQSLTLTR